MLKQDKHCSIMPYFKIHDGKLDEFKAGVAAFVEKTRIEPACLYYGFTFHGNRALCREGYADAEGVLAHIDNIGELLQQALTIAEIERLEIHGPKAELDKLREPLSELSPEYFELEDGFIR